MPPHCSRKMNFLDNFHVVNAYAHTPIKDEEWHCLVPHLLRTGLIAKHFGSELGIGEWCQLMGYAHDAGKFHPGFQAYLHAMAENKSAPKCPHAIWGAAFLYQCFGQKDSWKELALPILGHHTGLHCAALAEQNLVSHLNANIGTETWKLIKRQSAEILNSGLRAPLADDCPFARELRIRMAFSCLVDADYLDTESHFNPTASGLRGSWVRLADLWPIFRANHLSLMWSRRTARMSRFRRKVYFESRRAAKQQPGVFRLTVPTGGGKTRASIAFALRHAVTNPQHGFKRVIVALPFTSIVDQTASELRDIFGAPHVLEHQSQPENPGDTENDPVAQRLALAAENWDSPIVVTTTVQLFESLFANRPSRCRKLHNIANSILILDEVQTLPTELIRPTLNVLRLLEVEYGVTVVLCTATQPTIEKSHYLPEWRNREIPDIVTSHQALFRDLNRVRYEPLDEFAPEDLAKKIGSETGSVLAIFNTKKDALKIYEHLMGKRLEGLYHLSTLLCSHHRRAILAEIKQRLSSGSRVCLISTQVVEAGVDLDFPVVYRAIGPLDRIVQAAGRCNREFKQGTRGGRVVLFSLAGGRVPKGPYARGVQIAKQLLEQEGAMEKLTGTAIFEDYFVRLYRDVDLDRPKVDEARKELDYPSVNDRYRFIEPTEQFVVVNYDRETILPLIKMHRYEPSRATWRALQPYTVNLMKWDTDTLKQSMPSQIAPDLWQWDGNYDKTHHRGIMGDYDDPADLICYQ
jgi:CRISPR-associated endonuclease/helicase Cas3